MPPEVNIQQRKIKGFMNMVISANFSDNNELAVMQEALIKRE